MGDERASLAQTVSEGRKKKKIPRRRGGGQGGRQEKDAQQPTRGSCRRPHFANCPQRGVKSPPRAVTERPTPRLPRLGTNNKYIEVGKPLHRDKSDLLPERSKLQKFGGSQHPHKHIDPSVRRDSETEQRSCILVFAFRLWLAKVRRLRAELETSRKG